MARILFVDDEPKMLNGLKRMLRKKRKEWDMAFVESGRAALALLAIEPYEIIVADMRMPGMTGDELLAQVSDRYPEMTRIIMSGQPDQEAAMKAVRLAHQYLAKPVGADDLIGVLSRAARFRSSMVNSSMSKLISSIEMLPSPNRRCHEILEMIESKEASLRRIGRLISEDMGLSSNILKLVNSAFFSLPRRTADIVDAVVYLGLDVIKGLVLTHHLFSSFDFNRLADFSFDMLWNHSANTACMARAILKKEIRDDSLTDDIFIAGLMHDIGKLALGYVMEEEFREIIQESRKSNRRLWLVEAEHLGFTHAEVGAYLVSLWGLPENVIQAIQHHHHPQECLQRDFIMLAIIHAADILDHRLNVINADYATGELDAEYIKKHNLTKKMVDWLRICEELAACDEGETNG